MSSGVSEQMKLPGNAAKNVEERSIPWTQQVDEESSYGNPSSPIVDDNSSATNQNSTQFQYPPFNVKEGALSTWNNKSRRTAEVSSVSNYDANKKYNKPAYYNNKKDEYQSTNWGSNTFRRSNIDHSSGNYNKSNRYEDNRSNIYSTEKLDNRSNYSSTDDKKISSAPKKTTWASIASQPAKLTSRTTSTTSSHKKKGPGMPPPPMVPGKHNLDVNIWDLPNNNPPPVPSPPPPIDLSSSEINSDFSKGIRADFELNSYEDEGVQTKGQDSGKEDISKSSYSNNFGRSKNAPNNHSRKNWSPQTQSQPGQGARQMGNMRRIDGYSSGGGNNGGGGNVPGAGRYGERRGHYTPSRQDFDSGAYEKRDESLSSKVEVIDTSIEIPHAVLEELRDKNNYNPAEIDLETASSARFFVIKSYSEDDVHRSIKYEIWCSTDHGNKRLDDAFKERQKDGGKVLLFFSVNGSGHFCGMAQMMTSVDYNSTSSVWSQDKWKGKFKVKWIYVKDVPNHQLRHITLENNENKPVTNSRDAQEVPNVKGVEVLQILHAYKHKTSIFDDFYHYEKKQEEEVSSRKPLGIYDGPASTRSHYNVRQNDDRDCQRSGVGGAQPQRYFGTGSTYRERNSTYRGGYSGYNDRRFDNHRSGERSERGERNERNDIRDADNDRENIEYNNSSRNISKYDYNRRIDERMSKYKIRDRDNQEDQSVKADTTRDNNEYAKPDRNRSNDY